jgi:N-acetylmuramoyl-L-alanine amidase
VPDSQTGTAAASTPAPVRTTVVDATDDATEPEMPAPQPAAAPPQTVPKPSPRAASLTTPTRSRTKLVSVTGVRHWSTSVYTRVAIDLGDEVQYEAARVPNPDRIFFDLHGAKLSPELIGKSVAVTDDGFLKRIRVAQFSNDVTRIVLDVSDVSDYSAFLLPNPYRLIIDIHGRKPGTASTQQIAQTQPPVQTPPPVTARSAQASTPAATPAQAATNGPGFPSPIFTPQNNSRPTSATTAARSSTAPARPAQQSVTTTAANTPETVADPSATQEIASLGHQPDKVKATTHPTTAPIAASVAGTTPAQQPELTTATPPPATRSSKRSKPKPGTDAQPQAENASIHEADPTAAGGRSMVRALGLKIGRIVVDAGHGGHDSGTLGPDGIEEKDVVLDVSLRLGKLLKQRLGADVIFTRSDDTFIPLETRTAIANKAQADLFVSVHANSSPDLSARGVETYYLNFTSSPESLELAARENAVSQQSIHQLSDLVKKIALHDKIDESREFASDVQKYLYEGLDQGNPGLKDRGVKQAPFVVLIGANMPSILAEISFLTNPDDARQLRDPNYRQRIAESLYRGVARYISGLSGVRLAENSGHPGD